MENTYTAVFQQTNGWWIGRVEEVPGALAQERSLEEVRVSLNEALHDIIEANREASRCEKTLGNAIIEQITVAA